MAKVTLVFAALLIALGLAGYLGTGSQHPTALIPTWFGLALGVFGVFRNQPQRGAAQAVHAHQCDDRPAGLSGRGCVEAMQRLRSCHVCGRWRRTRLRSLRKVTMAGCC